MSPIQKRRHWPAKRWRNLTRKIEDGRVALDVWIGDRCVKALIDTGAAASFVNKDLAVFCRGIGWSTNSEYLAAKLVNGNETDIDESVTGIVNVLNREVNHCFMVLPSLPHEMILGMDVLRDKLDYRASVFGVSLIPQLATSVYYRMSPMKRNGRRCQKKTKKKKKEEKLDRQLTESGINEDRAMIKIALPDGEETLVGIGARKWTEFRSIEGRKVKRTLRFDGLHQLTFVGPWKEHV